MSYIAKKEGLAIRAGALTDKARSKRAIDPLKRMVNAMNAAEAHYEIAGQPGPRLVAISRDEFVKRYTPT